MRSSRFEARGKFGEQKRCVRVARGAAESNSSFLSALQTSQVHPKPDIRAAKSMSKFFNFFFRQICETCHYRALKKQELLEATPRATLTHSSWSPNFLLASYLDKRTADVWTNCFITFSTRWFKYCRIKNLFMLSSWLVSSIFQREGKLHFSLTGRKLWNQVKKNVHVILFTYRRA